MSTPGQVQLVRKVLEQQRRCLVPVVGDSMLPAINSGARVSLEPIPFEQLAPGDIVGFECQGELFVHRIIAHCGDRLITCGDNKPLLDPPVDRASYIGKVVTCERGDVPAAPPARRTLEAGRAVPAQIWAFVPPQHDLAAQEQLARAVGIELHFLPRKGMSLAVADRTWLQAELPAQALKVGISSRAVLSLRDALPALRAARQIAWVLGNHYGHLEQDDVCLLPVDTVELHLRCGQPYQDLPISAEIALVIGAMAMLDAL